MAIAPYLAMTAAEITQTDPLPERIAYIGCPFFKGNPTLPETMSADSLLVLTDQYPADLAAADDLIAQILSFGCRAVLLDFQKPDSKDSFAFAKKLRKALPCPVIVSDLYAKELDCPVFLPPVPLHARLTDHIKPWHGREIWLDLSVEAEKITLTEEGSSFYALPHFQPTESGHQEKNLHCHYSVSITENAAVFTLWRTREDLESLTTEAAHRGIKETVGLYQELEWL